MPSTAYVKIELSEDTVIGMAEDRITGRDITELVHSLQLRESLLIGDLEITLELIPETLASEDLLAFETGVRAIRLSVVRNGIEQTSGWKMFAIINASLYFQGTLPVLKLVGRGLSAILHEKIRWRSFIDVPAREVVKTIAEANSLQLNPSAANLPLNVVGTWYQVGETDWEFLRGDFQREISLSTGQRNVVLLLQNRTLNVFAIDFSAKAVRRFGIGSGDDRIEELLYVHRGREIDYLGGSQMEMVGFDIYNKNPLTYTPPDRAIPILAGRLGRPYGAGTRRKISTAQTQEEVNVEATAKWSQDTSKYFSLQFAVIADITLRLGDIVEMTALGPDKTSSVFNGKYPIYEILHQYTTTEEEGVILVTHLGGFRRTFHWGDNRATGTNLSGVRSEDAYLETNKTERSGTVLSAVSLGDG